MKHKEARDIIESRFKKINASFGAVVTDFATEDIHRFRVEIKKLRAFLHATKKGLTLPKQLKKFYSLASVIRNLQMQQQRIVKAAAETEDPLPSNYLSIVDAESFANIEKAKK